VVVWGDVWRSARSALLVVSEWEEDGKLLFFADELSDVRRSEAARRAVVAGDR
jgi:hypothetical protein